MPYKDPSKDKEYHREYGREWRKKYPEKCKEITKRHRKKYLKQIRERDRRIHQGWVTCQRCGQRTFGYKKRKYCDECRKIIQKQKMQGNQLWSKVKNRLKGENNPNWKGGLTFWKKRIWDSGKYKRWRKRVFERDNYTCQYCGVRGKYLEAHHIEPFVDLLRKYNITSKEKADNCEVLWDIELGITLCRECHSLTKNGRPKKILGKK